MAAAAAAAAGFLRSPFLLGGGQNNTGLAAAATRKERKRSRGAVRASLAGGDWANLVDQLFVGVGVGLPCTVMECGDIIYRSSLPQKSGLTLTAPGVALALAAASYLWATPGVAPGFFDMFVLAFVERLFRPTFRKVSSDDRKLRA